MNNAMAPQLLMFAAIFAIFYFILIRPQQQQKKKQEELLMGIKKGDEIITAGGIVGDVVYIKAAGADGTTTLDDRITIRSGESKLIVERGRIARVVTGGATISASGAKAAPSGSPT
jgi:preprotein translocase subunit YajC